MKQSAIEWFYIELKELIKKSELSEIKPSEFDNGVAKLLYQAKEIEKQQVYSEEDMKDYALKCISNYLFGEDFISYNLRIPIVENNDKQFEQFKKK